jgi:hypothetical protein
MEEEESLAPGWTAGRHGGRRSIDDDDDMSNLLQMQRQFPGVCGGPSPERLLPAWAGPISSWLTRRRVGHSCKEKVLLPSRARQECGAGHVCQTLIRAGNMGKFVKILGTECYIED